MARRLVDTALAEARRVHHVALELEARLTNAELAAGVRATGQARARIVALADDAEQRGFGLIARHARALVP
jgi:hypothetical protein